MLTPDGTVLQIGGAKEIVLKGVIHFLRSPRVLPGNNIIRCFEGQVGVYPVCHAASCMHMV